MAQTSTFYRDPATGAFHSTGGDMSPVTAPTNPIEAGGRSLPMSGPGASGQPVAPAVPASDPYSVFNKELLNILKSAQGSARASREGLTASKERLENQSVNLSNPLSETPYSTLFQGMSPEASLAAQRSTQAAAEPGVQRIENMMSLNNANLADTTSLVDRLANYASAAQQAEQARAAAARAAYEADRNYQLAVDQFEEEKKGRQTSVVTGAGGQTMLIDTQTGEVIKNYGLANVPKEGETPLDASTIDNQFDTARSALAKAKELAFAAGRGKSWLEAQKQGLFGATDYTNLEAYANTLRTSILTLATDPAVKKFFGPQMSNADVQLMMAAGTSLNPELMTPSAFADELARYEELLNRLSAAKGVGGASGGGAPAASGRVQVISPNGVKGDIPAAQLSEALKSGYKLAPGGMSVIPK